MPPGPKEPIALIIDTSSSVTDWWDETKRTAEKIYLLLAGSHPCKLYKVGSAMEILESTFKQLYPPGHTQQAQACSLIAPILEVLVQQVQKHFLIIVGGGEIFDLLDWTEDPRIGGWLLVRTTGQSLQAKSSELTEITPEEIQDKETLLSYFSSAAPKPRAGRAGRSKLEAYQFSVDESQYPLIYVEPLKSSVQLLPVTKPQFEKFIVSGKQSDFGDTWYDMINKLNPRAAYRNQDFFIREQLFMTGITLSEAFAFSRWMGPQYSLLSADQWRSCYNWFKTQPMSSIPAELAGKLARDAQAIWETLESRYLFPSGNLQEFSLMTQGILEWVEEGRGRYCGLGEPASSVYQRDVFDPVRPLPGRRIKNLGFRLMRRGF